MIKTFNELFNEHTGDNIKKWSNYGEYMINILLLIEIII